MSLPISIIQLVITLHEGDALNYTFLGKIFYLAFVLYISSFTQVWADFPFKGGDCESAQKTSASSETGSIIKNDDGEFLDFGVSDDTVWFSVVSATSPPLLEIDATALDFGETETAKTFSMTNSGDDTLVWSLYEDEEWITVDVTTGSLEAAVSATLTVEVDRAKVLIIGEVDGTITISSNGGDAEIEVAMKVPEQPVLEVSPSALDFGSKDVFEELSVSNSGTGVLAWVITAPEEWITVDQESGSTEAGNTDAINIMVDRSTMAELGKYNGELSVTSDGGEATVSVVIEKINHAPEIPAVVLPLDGATEQSLYASLSWQGGDADAKDGDIVSYDVYFSANESLVDISDISVLTCSGMKVCYCDPGTNSLEYTTTYYWKVVAKDSYGEITTGSVWSFTTEDDTNNNLCPAFALDLGFQERHLLRVLRDRVLAQDENGRKYISQYYRYSRELLLILFINDELRVKSMELCEELLPAIKNLLAYHETVVSAEMMEEIRKFLGKVALCASPPLKAVLKSIESDIEKREKLEQLGIIVSK